MSHSLRLILVLGVSFLTATFSSEQSQVLLVQSGLGLRQNCTVYSRETSMHRAYMNLSTLHIRKENEADPVILSSAPSSDTWGLL